MPCSNAPGPDTSELFPLWFDLSLLTGDEAKPCEALNKNSALMKSYAAQISVTRGRATGPPPRCFSTAPRPSAC